MRVPQGVSWNGIRATVRFTSSLSPLSLSLCLCLCLSLPVSFWFLSLSLLVNLGFLLSLLPLVSASLSVSLSLSLSLSHTLTPHREMPLLWTWEGIGKEGLTMLNVWCPWQSAGHPEKTERPLCSGQKRGWAGKGWLHEEGAPERRKKKT